MLGKRMDYKVGHPITPHNVTFVFMGTSFLWLGWFGFNAGSGLAADGLAANAFLVTHVATAMAAITWMVTRLALQQETHHHRRLYGSRSRTGGNHSGGRHGRPAGAFCIGIITPIVCFFMVAAVKPKVKYDDALDAFGVHGIGGIIGSILTGVFATRSFRAEDGVQGALYGDWHQLWVQIVAPWYLSCSARSLPSSCSR